MPRRGPLGGFNKLPCSGQQLPCFSPPKFPVQFLRETPKKTVGYRYILSSADAATALISRISLYFSLLAGNLGRRPVRNGLRRQARSLVRTSATSVGTAAARRTWFDQGITNASKRAPAAQNRVRCEQLIRKVVFPYQLATNNSRDEHSIRNMSFLPSVLTSHPFVRDRHNPTNLNMGVRTRDRSSRLRIGGRGFESLRARQLNQLVSRGWRARVAAER